MLVLRVRRLTPRTIVQLSGFRMGMGLAVGVGYGGQEFFCEGPGGISCVILVPRAVSTAGIASGARRSHRSASCPR
jgi:hypothetical protein